MTVNLDNIWKEKLYKFYKDKITFHASLHPDNRAQNYHPSGKRELGSEKSVKKEKRFAFPVVINCLFSHFASLISTKTKTCH